MEAKLSVMLDNVDDKKDFKTRTLQYDTNPSVVVRQLVKKWMNEHPIKGSSANTIG
jgi:hypothetical protein